MKRIEPLNPNLQPEKKPSIPINQGQAYIDGMAVSKNLVSTDTNPDTNAASSTMQPKVAASIPDEQEQNLSKVAPISFATNATGLNTSLDEVTEDQPPKNKHSRLYIISAVVGVVLTLSLAVFFIYQNTQETTNHQAANAESDYKTYYTTCYDVQLPVEYKDVTVGTDSNCYLKVNADTAGTEPSINIGKIGSYTSLKSYNNELSAAGEKPVQVSDTLLRIDSGFTGKAWTKLYVYGSDGKLGQANKQSVIVITVVTYGEKTNPGESAKIADDILNHLSAPTKNLEDATKQNEQSLTTKNTVKTPCYSFALPAAVNVSVTKTLTERGNVASDKDCQVLVNVTTSDDKKGSLSVQKLTGTDGAATIQRAYDIKRADNQKAPGITTIADTTTKVDGLNSIYFGNKQEFQGTVYSYSIFTDVASKKYKDEQRKQIAGFSISVIEPNDYKPLPQPDVFTQQVLAGWHWQ